MACRAIAIRIVLAIPRMYAETVSSIKTRAIKIKSKTALMSDHATIRR